MTVYEEVTDGEFLFPMRDECNPDSLVWGHVFFSHTGVVVHVHQRKPESTGDKMQTQMCGLYVELWDGKVQAQIYDEVGEQHDDIHYEFGGENESIVLVKNVEQWKPETENDEEGVS